jgi:hypothetical protein
MASVIVQELDAIAGLVDAQCEAGLVKAEVLSAMCASWKSRFGQFQSMSVLDTHAITNALNRGPWATHQKKQLAMALANPIMCDDIPRGRRSMQHCPHFENFIPEHHWICIRDSVRYVKASRLGLLASLAWCLNINCPSEGTLFQMVKIIAYCAGLGTMTQAEVFADMGAIKDMIKSRRDTRPVGLPYLLHFPTSASELPQLLKDHAYNGKPFPVDVDIPALSCLLSDRKKRGKKVDTSWMNSVPAEYRTVLMPHMASESRGGIHKGSSMAHLQLDNHSDASSPNQSAHAAKPQLRMLGDDGAYVRSPSSAASFRPPRSFSRHEPYRGHPSASPGTQPLHVMGSPDDGSSTDAGDGLDGDGDGADGAVGETLDDMEEKMLAASASRASSKPIKAKSSNMKRPSCMDAPSGMKKPAAAGCLKAATSGMKKPAAAAFLKASNATFTDEVTRSQIMCRYGKGPGSTHAIKYTKGSKANAIKLAKAWVAAKS